MTKRQIVALTAAIALFAAAVVILVILGGIAFAVAAAVAIVLLAVVLPWSVVRRARKHFDRIAFPGAQWEVGYGPTSMLLSQPTASANISYSVFDTVHRGHGGTVLVHYAGSRLLLVLPDALCPPPALDLLTQSIREAGTR